MIEVRDPFLFCVHHRDAYPPGDDRLAPRASLEGREIGSDFEGKDGWRMYHGSTVPGFPQHPHRGFETVTIVRSGFIDHSDSLGATARFGRGDVQWLTAGKGVVHSEMFPLLERDRDNPLELFQIWLNLPRRSKLVDPYFTMFWREQVPVVERDGAKISVIAGALGDARPLPPPPESWAATDPDFKIWLIEEAPGAKFDPPPAPPGVNRTLHRVGERDLLLLQGRPIGEHIAQYGPFVMTTDEELLQAFADYRRTGFGGWPWPTDDPVHARSEGRFARYPDGRIDRPGSKQP